MLCTNQRLSSRDIQWLLTPLQQRFAPWEGPWRNYRLLCDISYPRTMGSLSVTRHVWYPDGPELRQLQHELAGFSMLVIQQRGYRQPLGELYVL